MDLKANHGAPVLGDTVPATKPRLGGLPTGLSLVPYSAPGTPFSPGMYLTVPRKNVLVSGWLESMMCSSPPRRKLGKGLNNDVAMEEAADSLYKAWTLKYPSAITSFELIANSAKGKRLALFLDYDGTLSPIVDDPEMAFMSNAMRSAVKRVAKYFPTAIISGRSRDKVFEFVGLTELHYAGSHGMDIMGPVRISESVGDHPNCIRSTDKQGKEVHLFQPASKFVPMIDEVFRTLVKSTNGIKGAKVENNKFCVSVHYRLVEEKNWPVVAQIVHDILKGYPELRLTHGRKVLEVRPVIDWNKGKAVEFLLDSLALNDSEDVLPIYIGDDRTDEDAFKVLRERNLGYGILVSSVPKESSAFYSLKDTSEVLDFLKLLTKWKKASLPVDE